MKTEKGFTLIEYIIVIVLFGVISALSASLLSQTFKAYFSGKNITDLAIKTSIATNNVLRELKNAESLNTLAATSLTFTNQSGQTIVIDWSGTNLRRNVNGAGAQTVCNQVTSVAFGFFDQAFTTTAVANNVRFVTLQITTTNDGYPFSLMGGTVLRKLLP